VPWRGISAAGAVVGLWGVTALRTYGTVIPQSLLAKSGQVTAGLGDAGGPSDIAAQLAGGVSSAQFATLPAVVRAALTVVAGIGAVLCVVDLVRRLRAGHAAAVFPATYLALTGLYVVGDPVRVWSWYTVPTALAWAWTVTDVGTELLARRSPVRLRRLVAPAVVILVTLVAAASLVVGIPRRQGSTAESVAELTVIGEVLASRVPPPASIMTGDIGAVGWETDARILDLSGLVSTAPVEAGPTGGLPSLGALVDRFTPDAIVLQVPLETADVVPEGSVIRPAFDDPEQRLRFTTAYELIVVPGSDRYVYVRRGQ